MISNTRSFVKYFRDSSRSFSFTELDLYKFVCIDKAIALLHIILYLASPAFNDGLDVLCSVEIYSVLRSHGTLRLFNIELETIRFR